MMETWDRVTGVEQWFSSVESQCSHFILAEK